MLNFKILSQKRGQDDGSQYCATATANGKGHKGKQGADLVLGNKGKRGFGEGALKRLVITSFFVAPASEARIKSFVGTSAWGLLISSARGRSESYSGCIQCNATD